MDKRGGGGKTLIHKMRLEVMFFNHFIIKSYFCTFFIWKLFLLYFLESSKILLYQSPRPFKTYRHADALSRIRAKFKF